MFLAERRELMKANYPDLVRLARAGDANAQCDVALLLMKITDNHKDGPAIEGWLLKASKKGHSDAKYWLGMIYLDGWYGKPDQRKAVELLHESANQGQKDAMLKLGQLYEAGRGVVRDAIKAKDWIRKGSPKTKNGILCNQDRFVDRSQAGQFDG